MLLAAVASSARLAMARAHGAPMPNRDNLRIIAENLINSATSLTRRHASTDTISRDCGHRDHHQDCHRRRRHRVRAGSIRHRPAGCGAHRADRQERGGAARAGARGSRAHRSHRARPAAAPCGRGRARASDPQTRSGPAADPRVQRDDCHRGGSARSRPRSVSPATSTNTARFSTSCRRWRHTSFPTTSTGAAARASCSASRWRIDSATPLPPR